jgi:hypothetical protein
MNDRSITAAAALLRLALAPTLVACCLFSAGCGGTPGNRVRGAVTFDGKPVPSGKVYFKPDSEAGNSGATGFADIVDGRYDTGSRGARNVGTGAMVISVEGVDPQGSPADGDTADVTAKVLFLGYELRQEIAAGDVTLDISVPADAALPPSAQPSGSISP